MRYLSHLADSFPCRSSQRRAADSTGMPSIDATLGVGQLACHMVFTDDSSVGVSCLKLRLRNHRRSAQRIYGDTAMPTE